MTSSNKLIYKLICTKKITSDAKETFFAITGIKCFVTAKFLYL
jgi:hypothetical protein